MSSAQYLERRASGIYFVRLYVPARLKAAVGKGEIHRTTGCRDYRLAKIVAAELSAHWHRSIQAMERMDITKIKSGSIKLLGDGLVSVSEAAAELGTKPLQLATQLAIKNINFFVKANNWPGWAVDDFHKQFDHMHDDTGQLQVVLDFDKLGGRHAQVKFTGMQVP